MRLLEQIKEKIIEKNEELAQLASIEKWVSANLHLFEGLPDASLCCEYIDFDFLPHEQIMDVMKAFRAGRW
jgi:hypothetical protein